MKVPFNSAIPLEILVSGNKIRGSFAPSDSWKIADFFLSCVKCLSVSIWPPAGKRRAEGFRLNRTPISVCKLLACWGRGKKSGTAARIKMRGRKLGKQNSHSARKKSEKGFRLQLCEIPQGACRSTEIFHLIPHQDD